MLTNQKKRELKQICCKIKNLKDLILHYDYTIYNFEKSFDNCIFTIYKNSRLSTPHLSLTGPYLGVVDIILLSTFFTLNDHREPLCL